MFFRRKFRVLTAYALIALLLWGCVSSGDPGITPGTSPSPSLGVLEPTPTPTAVEPLPTPSPTPVPTPSPTPEPEPTPTPTPIVHSLAEFLPTEDLHIRYDSKKSKNFMETYVEFTGGSESSPAVQHRVISKSAGDPEVRVTRCEEGKLVISYRKSGVGYTYRFLDYTSNHADVLLMEPVEAGTSWPVKDGTRTITDTDHIIDLPIGTFRAVEVTTDYDSGKQTLQYYVPSIGLVAEYAAENGAIVDSDDSFEATLLSTGQGFPQLIRFYYAQPVSDSVRYENRTVNIKPDSSMGSRFVNQLRTVPSGKGLLALDGLSIKSIKLDGKGYVHVDFSASLTKIVSSVGRVSESLILIALANTFCEYYQTDRLYLTVAGKEYESPYRFFMEGEYLSPNYARAKALG